MTALPKQRYTIGEYIELDKNSEERFEYFNGEVFSMAGASPNHVRICRNVCNKLSQKLEGRDCEAFPGDMRIRVPATWLYRYPDVSAVCGEQVYETIQGLETLTNPVLLVEVLSEITAAYDLDEKFTEYQSIESFREYLLIAQDRPHVIRYVRQTNGWLRTETDGLENAVTLESLGVSLPLSEIYMRVKFPSAQESSSTSETNQNVI